MTKIKVILVDDHAILRAGLKLLLEAEKDIEIVEEACNGEELMNKLTVTETDLIILDLSMPGINGIDLLKLLKTKKTYKNIRILVLTMHTEEEYIREALAAGADGYVEKSAFDTELLTALHTVMKGETYLNNKNALSMLNTMIKNDNDDNPYLLLSKRELEVLRYLARGYSLAEIGSQLHLSLKTIDTYKTRIFTKLDISKKSELVNYALRYKLFDLPEK
ncbi:LuxR family two component transcriptional regulator [Pectinatus cerevisiiphilus]|uniref:LuxR family two component transcriptional regulator n=2 Tax=Pectinatus cerevisiiphilus TaxID=86956 RepID=A0A4V2URD1_9FIRM|nr:LuxR family two component transcriptional regulator [Pectinatus cerevisiiphilus]